MKAFEHELDQYWQRKYKIKYDYDRCTKFETRMSDGTGTKDIETYNYIAMDKDLGSQST